MTSRYFSYAAICMALVPGCASIGPTPAPALEQIELADWSDYLTREREGQDSHRQPFWTSINDPALNELIADTIAGSKDLAIAASRLREARASHRADIAALGPSIGVESSAVSQRQTETGVLPVERIPGYETEYVLYDAHFDARWEADLFGRKDVRRELAAARLSTEEERYADVEVSLTAELVRAYIDLRGAQAERELLNTIIDRQKELQAGIQFRHKQGEASDIDYERALAQLANYEARRPPIVAAVRAAIYRIAQLTGKEVRAVESRLLDPRDLPAIDFEPAIGTASDLLRSRPDVRIAERNYVVAARSSDIAQLNLYPTLSLFGSAGPSSIQISDLLSPTSLALDLGAMIEWTVFDGGQKLAQTDAASERLIQAELSYRAAVLAALADVESSFANYVETGRELKLSEAAAASRLRLIKMASARFEGGTGTVIDILEAEREAAEAQITTVRLKARHLIERVALEKAIGVPGPVQ